MMSFLIPHRLPKQYIFVGEDHTTLFLLNGRRLAAQREFPGLSLLDDTAGLEALQRELLQEDLGISLGPTSFIFNIFEFETLPFTPAKRREIVEWRLQKVFPENIEAYDHQYFHLSRTRILSTLIRRSVLERLHALLQQSRIAAPIFIGSSTLESITHTLRGRRSPDFFLETDGDSSVLVFQKRRTPVYIRKFKGGAGEALAAEVRKTVQYVSGNYALTANRFRVIHHGSATDHGVLSAALREAGLTEMPLEQRLPFLPGAPWKK